MALGNSNVENNTNYNKYYISFRRGNKDSKPYFAVNYNGNDNGNVSKVSGTLQGVFHNPEMEKMKKDGTPFIAQENYVVRLVDGDNQYNVQVDVQSGQQLRGMLNSLLSTSIGDIIELSTYISQGKYKVISVTNPNVQKEIEFERDGEKKKAKVNEGYKWAIDMKDLPSVEVTKNKKGEVVDVDDSEVNAFFKEKVLEKFGSKDHNTTEASDDEVSVEDLPF